MSDKKIHFYAAPLMAVLLALIAVSCSQNKDIDTMSWGKCTSYGDFLWKKHIPDTLTREIVLEFNSDAERYMTSPVVFGIFRKTEDGSLVPVTITTLRCMSTETGTKTTPSASCLRTNR